MCDEFNLGDSASFADRVWSESSIRDLHSTRNEHCGWNSGMGHPTPI